MCVAAKPLKGNYCLYVAFCLPLQVGLSSVNRARKHIFGKGCVQAVGCSLTGGKLPTSASLERMRNLVEDQSRYEDCSCETLAGCAQEGDLNAFSELVRRHENGLRHFLMPFVQNARPSKGEDASDLVQQTFIRAFQRLEKYNTKKPFKPWLYTLARRNAVSRYRRVAREAELGPDTAEFRRDTVPGPDEHMITEEQRRNLWKLAEIKLKQRQYQVLWLFYGEELSIKEIGKIMGLTSVNVRVSLYRGRQILAEELAVRSTEDVPGYYSEWSRVRRAE